MKKLGKLHLHDLSKAEMEKREQNLIKGGSCVSACLCGCRYSGTQSDPTDSYYGGSSNIDNGDSNLRGHETFYN
ncbi:TIGR04149 family rSAM-modified RiPP [Parabacteroides sp. Marseille-P3160]|uniref:TIGR04149 family rSAM-modified RiPP n=1 Tax=Parabacteroides sp. Marseille-P3160 TaxID=1917887 RepID=UPI0009B9AAF6|nr:TIGR04149 family rSAM-modified RiPP [Parabacteroides sp. Marseille-P3160]